MYLIPLSYVYSFYSNEFFHADTENGTSDQVPQETKSKMIAAQNRCHATLNLLKIFVPTRSSVDYTILFYFSGKRSTIAVVYRLNLRASIL